jgi:hypothetical protein
MVLDRKIVVGVVLGVMVVLLARYAQVEAADKHSSPFTSERSFDVKQLWELPDR